MNTFVMSFDIVYLLTVVTIIIGFYYKNLIRKCNIYKKKSLTANMQHWEAWMTL